MRQVNLDAKLSFFSRTLLFKILFLALAMYVSPLLWSANKKFWGTVWQQYNHYLIRQPLLTKVVTAGSFAVIGDAAAQVLTSDTVKSLFRHHHHEQPHHELEHKPSSSAHVTHASMSLHEDELERSPFKYDPWRTFRMSSWALVVSGPIGHYWYTFLDTAFPSKAIVTSIGKMLLDQAIMTPPQCAAFFAYIGLAEGKTWPEAKEKVKENVGPTLMLNYCVWPMAHVAGFCFVPPAHRVLYLSVLGLAWTTVLSVMANRPNKMEPSPKHEKHHGSHHHPTLPRRFPE